MTACDLHTHTTNSDGTQSFERLVQRAGQAGVKVLAITDHNYATVLQPHKEGDVFLVPAAEFSSFYTSPKLGAKNEEVHIVGLFFNGLPQDFNRRFDYIAKQRREYLDAIFEKLETACGARLSLEMLKNAFPQARRIGRKHIALWLADHGYAKDVDDAFNRFVGRTGSAYVASHDKIQYPSMQAIVQDILSLGGIPVLAHPFYYPFVKNEQDLKTFAKDFAMAAPIRQGDLLGMEVEYKNYSESQKQALARTAKELGLFASSASDSHGEETPLKKAPMDPALERRLREMTGENK